MSAFCFISSSSLTISANASYLALLLIQDLTSTFLNLITSVYIRLTLWNRPLFLIACSLSSWNPQVHRSPSLNLHFLRKVWNVPYPLRTCIIHLSRFYICILNFSSSSWYYLYVVLPRFDPVHLICHCLMTSFWILFFASLKNIFLPFCHFPSFGALVILLDCIALLPYHFLPRIVWLLVRILSRWVKSHRLL